MPSNFCQGNYKPLSYFAAGAMPLTGTQICSIFISRMFEDNPRVQDAIQELGEAVAIGGTDFFRYRNFLGAKVARRFMDSVGLHLTGDDVGNAALTELLGTVVTNGIVLGMRGTTTQEAVDEAAAGLLDQLLPELRNGVGPLIPHLVTVGVVFHRDELVPGTDEIAGWKAEFQQLQAGDPAHTNWTDEVAGE